MRGLGSSHEIAVVSLRREEAEGLLLGLWCTCAVGSVADEGEKGIYPGRVDLGVDTPPRSVMSPMGVGQREFKACVRILST